MENLPIAYLVHDLNPYIVRIYGNIGLQWYGTAYVLGFLFGYLLYRRLAKRGLSQLRPEQVGDFITGAAIYGVLLGGRLGYMLFYDFSEFIHNPLTFFKVWDGGMSSHGGMLGLIFYTIWFAWRHKLSWVGLGDNLGVVAPVGLFFGRCANFINGELYGRATNVSWAMQFPKELLANGDLAQRAVEKCNAADPSLTTVDSIIVASRNSAQIREILSKILTPRHPSQIYEALLEGAFLFSVLWILRTKVRLARGMLSGIFFILYALVRIVCEHFREPDFGVERTLGLTRGQFLSLFLVLIGIAFIVYAKLRPQFEKAQENPKPLTTNA